MKCYLGISDFLKDFSKSFSFYCFPLFLCIVHLRTLSFLSLLFSGTLHSVGYIFPFFLCLLLIFSAICKSSSDNHFAFLHFFFLGIVMVTTSCTRLWTSIHSSSGTLPNLIPWIYSSPPLYNHNDLKPVMVWASLVAQTVKNLPAMQETWVQSLGQEDPLEKEMATPSGVLAWEIP